MSALPLLDEDALVLGLSPELATEEIIDILITRLADAGRTFEPMELEELVYAAAPHAPTLENGIVSVFVDRGPVAHATVALALLNQPAPIAGLAIVVLPKPDPQLAAHVNECLTAPEVTTALSSTSTNALFDALTTRLTDQPVPAPSDVPPAYERQDVGIPDGAEASMKWWTRFKNGLTGK